MNCKEIFEEFDHLNVLVIGDVMVDTYQAGKAGRISPEAPVPVVEWEREESRLGGAANVALNVQALGGRAFLCGVVGEDVGSSQFFSLMPEAGLSEAGILASRERCTTVKTRIIAENQHLLRLDKENTHDLTTEEASSFLKKVREIAEQHSIHVCILQDYNKGVLSEEVIRQVLGLMQSHRIPVAVDPKFRNFWAYRDVALFKPNLKEVRNATGLPVTGGIEDLKQASKLMRNRLHHGCTLITLSENGAYAGDAENGHLMPTMPRNVADVCGAGDTVIAVASMALAIGLGLEEIALLSNLAGGQVVEKVGVVPVDRRQLQKEILAAITAE
jgi:D-glycero-beta-D-manno-heptose-7-phosphate kinase